MEESILYSTAGLGLVLMLVTLLEEYWINVMVICVNTNSWVEPENILTNFPPELV